MVILACPHCDRTIRPVYAFPGEPVQRVHEGGTWRERRVLQCNWCGKRFDYWTDTQSFPAPPQLVPSPVPASAPVQYEAPTAETGSYRSSPRIVKSMPIPPTPFWKKVVRFRTVWRMLKRRQKRAEIFRTETRVRTMVQDQQFARPDVFFQWVPHSPRYVGGGSWLPTDGGKYHVAIAFGETWWGQQIESVFVEGETPELLLAALYQALGERGRAIFTKFQHYAKDLPPDSPLWRDKAFQHAMAREVDAFAHDVKNRKDPDEHLRRLAQGDGFLVPE